MSVSYPGVTHNLRRLAVSSALMMIAACSDTVTAPRDAMRQVTGRRPDVQIASTTIVFASDESWGGQRVCLRSSPCATGAVSWNYPGPGNWNADLSPLPGASWIWSSGLNGFSSPSYPATFSFSKTFELSGSPITAVIRIAADDSATVFVNDNEIGGVGGIQSPYPDATGHLTSFDIASFLHTGTNTITVRGSNGVNPTGCAGTYSCNPAGVVFGGSIDYTPNSAPTISMGSAFFGVEGSQIDIGAIGAADVDGDQLSYVLTFGDTPAPVSSPSSINGSLDDTDAPGGAVITPSLTHSYGDNGTYTVTLTVTEVGKTPALSATANATVTVTNAAPVISVLTLPSSPVPLGTSVAAVAAYTDAGWRDTHTALLQWDWDSETATSTGAASTGIASAGIANGSNTYTAAGVYTVRVLVTDDDGEVASRSSAADISAYVVVYDPAGGFVTGAGWIESPVAACRFTACASDGTAVGKATFGFVSRYARGATVPTGTTEFHFQAGGLKFQSVSYQWLVIAGGRAQYKGEGTINGVGHYGFILTAIDGQLNGGDGSDKLRIKIWDLDNASASVIYDNQMGALDDGNAATALGGGVISIKAK